MILESQEAYGSTYLNYKEYDSNNNLTAEYSVSGGEEYWRKNYEYDANNNLTSEYEVWDGEIAKRTDYEYDAANIKITCKKYVYGIISSETRYNSNGDEIYEAGYDSDGNIESWRDYIYDENYVRTNIYIYDADGNLTFWEEDGEYDEYGNLLNNKWFNADGSLDSRNIWEYDNHGNEIHYIQYLGDGSINKEEQREYEYDNAGNKIRCTEIYPSKIVSEYNARGDIIKYTFYRDGNVDFYQEYEYQYFE